MANTTDTEDSSSSYRLSVPNSQIALQVGLVKFATSNAGTNGFKFSNLCEVHGENLKRLDYCPACGIDKPIPGTLKQYRKGIVLKPEWIQSRKPKGDGTITVIQCLEDPTILDLDLIRVVPEAHFVVPTRQDTVGMKIYAALHATLCDEAGRPARAMQVRFVKKGTSSPRTVHGLIRALPNGILVFEERYHFRDTNPKANLDTDVYTPKPEQRRALAALGASLVKPLDPDSFNVDPFRESLMNEVLAPLARKEQVIESPLVVLPEVTLPADDDLDIGNLATPASANA